MQEPINNAVSGRSVNHILSSNISSNIVPKVSSSSSTVHPSSSTSSLIPPPLSSNPSSQRNSMNNKLTPSDLSSSSSPGIPDAEFSESTLYDVIIVGCGPVGAYASSLFRQYGLQVRTIEKDSTYYSSPRAVAMDDECVRWMGLSNPELGKWLDNHVSKCPVEIRSGVPPYNNDNDDNYDPPSSSLEENGENKENQSTTEKKKKNHHHPLPRAKVGYPFIGPIVPHTVPLSGYTDTVFFHQPLLEEQLRRYAFNDMDNVHLHQRLEVMNIQVQKLGDSVRQDNTLPSNQVRRTLFDSIIANNSKLSSSSSSSSSSSFSSPSSLHSIGPWAYDTEIVAVRTRDSLTNETRTHKCRYLIGADGGRSTVRSALKIGFEGETFKDQRWLVLDIESTDPCMAERWKYFNFVCDPSRPFVHVPLPDHPSGRRFEFIENPEDDPQEITTYEFAHKLLRSIGVDAHTVKFIRDPALYTFHARRALQWRKGPVMLMGDAAHCMPPFRGQGMCAGLRDAVNVCWKIATAVMLQKEAEDYCGNRWLLQQQGNLSTNPSLPRDPFRTVTDDNMDNRLMNSALLAQKDIDNVLNSYQMEREDHLVKVTNIAVSMGKIIMIRSRILAILRNNIFTILDRLPVIGSIVKNPFAPPIGFNKGYFDYRDIKGNFQRFLPKHSSSSSSSSTVTKPTTAVSSSGWIARDEATGKPVPNFLVTILDTSNHSALSSIHPRHVRLDEAVWNLVTHTANANNAPVSINARALGWTILLAPKVVTWPADRHPTARLSTHTYERLIHAYVPRFTVLQVIPGCSGPERMAAHRAWSHHQTLQHRDHKPINEYWFSRVQYSVADTSTELHTWFTDTLQDATVIVLRPDHLVYGIYTENEWPEALHHLLHLFGNYCNHHLQLHHHRKYDDDENDNGIIRDTKNTENYNRDDTLEQDTSTNDTYATVVGNRSNTPILHNRPSYFWAKIYYRVTHPVTLLGVLLFATVTLLVYLGVVEIAMLTTFSQSVQHLAQQTKSTVRTSITEFSTQSTTTYANLKQQLRNKWESSKVSSPSSSLSAQWRNFFSLSMDNNKAELPVDTTRDYLRDINITNTTINGINMYSIHGTNISEEDIYHFLHPCTEVYTAALETKASIQGCHIPKEENIVCEPCTEPPVPIREEIPCPDCVEYTCPETQVCEKCECPECPDCPECPAPPVCETCKLCDICPPLEPCPSIPSCDPCEAEKCPLPEEICPPVPTCATENQHHSSSSLTNTNDPVPSSSTVSSSETLETSPSFVTNVCPSFEPVICPSLVPCPTVLPLAPQISCPDAPTPIPCPSSSSSTASVTKETESPRGKIGTTPSRIDDEFTSDTNHGTNEGVPSDQHHSTDMTTDPSTEEATNSNNWNGMYWYAPMGLITGIFGRLYVQ